MSPHPLDRPVWNALATGWSALAQGDRRAKRIDPRYGPFAAAGSNPEALAALVPDDGELWIVERDPLPLPSSVLVRREAMLAQMIADDAAAIPVPALRPTLLSEADASEMRALANLTRPGPFHPLTHRLGRFVGVRDKGMLVAMAGERMRMPGLAEVSGVCTHPDYRGRGHAKALMRCVMQAMRARGETPFLHAYAAHAATVAMYETLGFRVRAEMRMTVIARD
jgi:ribosomal protein S18 acetylase RimI-like enzyme